MPIENHLIASYRRNKTKRKKTHRFISGAVLNINSLWPFFLRMFTTSSCRWHIYQSKERSKWGWQLCFVSWNSFTLADYIIQFHSQKHPHETERNRVIFVILGWFMRTSAVPLHWNSAKVLEEFWGRVSQQKTFCKRGEIARNDWTKRRWRRGPTRKQCSLIQKLGSCLQLKPTTKPLQYPWLLTDFFFTLPSWKGLLVCIIWINSVSLFRALWRISSKRN